MTFTRRRLLKGMLASPVLPLIGCNRNVPSLPKDKILQKYPVKTYAVGRFLIDLPDVATDLHPRTGMQMSVPSMPMKLKVHDVEKAMSALRAKVTGFWVEMPLEWGSGETYTPKPPANSPQLIARESPITVGEVG